MKTILFLIFLLIQIIGLAQSKEESISVATTGCIIQGSLYVPQGKKSFSVLIVIAGSGPTDRYGNSTLGIKANSYKMLAEQLADQDIGVLLYDKKGMAKSISNLNEADLRFEDYVNDVVKWVKMLQRDKRIKNIYLAGHSEGSLIGMLAVQKVKVKGYISIAGPAKGIAGIITAQYAKQLPKAAPIVDSLFERLKAGKIIDTVPPYLQSIFRPSVQPYIKSWMKYIPANEIKKITIPILIVQGGTDLQVDSAEANLLRQANPKAQLIILDSMNHILKNASVYRMQNLATYSNPALPLAPGLIKAIAIFIIQNKNEGFKTAVKRCCN